MVKPRSGSRPQAKTPADELEATHATSGQRATWFTRLSGQAQADLLEIRKYYAAGRYADKRVTEIHTWCAARFHLKIQIEGFRRWLNKKPP